MSELLETLATLSVLVFVIGSMTSMGLSLKLPQIMSPLKNVKLVVLALVANFIVVPIIAIVITLVILMPAAGELSKRMQKTD
jgi:BASS family bile acid:Na+ symporter